MSIQLPHYEKHLKAAMHSFWNARTQAADKQEISLKRDHGNRGAVTGGKNLDGFRDLITGIIMDFAPRGTDFILVEDAIGSTSKVAAKSHHFLTDPIFQESNYQQRMRILCERMMEQRLYNSAAVLTSPKEAAKSGESKNLSDLSSLRWTPFFGQQS